MSKHITPEVGDVWYNEVDDEKIRVLKLLEESNGEKCVRVLIKETYGVFIETFALDNLQLKDFIYLGKSKANIEQLFEVENEE